MYTVIRRGVSITQLTTELPWIKQTLRKTSFGLAQKRLLETENASQANHLSNPTESMRSFQKAEEIPGLRAQDFKDIFLESKRTDRKTYPYRWDFHLRMLLYALFPPALLYFCTEVIDHFMLNDPEIQEILKDTRFKDKENRKVIKGIQDMGGSLENRISQLENELVQIKEGLEGGDNARIHISDDSRKETGGSSTYSDHVERARRWSRQMSRSLKPKT